MTEYRYPFTGAYDRVFPDLSHGDGVRVLRVVEDGAEPVEVEADAGSTVLLKPGDVLVTAEPLPFAPAELDGADGPPEPEPAAEPAAEPEPPAETPARRRRGAPDVPAGDSAGDTPSDAGDAGATA